MSETIIVALLSLLGSTADAYNLVTIDTKNQLVKLIRGGGADSDKYHRNRKAICFHYGTGEIYGE